MDGTLSDAAIRGQTLFNNHNCASCHDPNNDYQDGTSHFVGTLTAASGGRLGGLLSDINTPSLLGLHSGAPYFHDGSADTLAEVFTNAGGSLIQAEDSATTTGGAFANDVSWTNYKEWHNSQFLEFNGGQSGTATYSVSSLVGGSGNIRIRYNWGYGNAPMTLRVNGSSSNHSLPPTPNDPQWMPNEWRYYDFPVNFQAGNNSIVFESGGTGPSPKIDDILFTTPDDLIAANAHVRGFSSSDLDDLVAFLNSLDSSNAAVPSIRIMRETLNILPGMSDSISADGMNQVTLVYTIENQGIGPLNIGQFHIQSDVENAFTIVRHPVATLDPGQTTELEIRISSVNGVNGLVEVFTDSPSAESFQWTLQVTGGMTTFAQYFHLY